MKRSLSIVLAAGLAASASGQTIEWNNASGGDWNTAANWNPQNVPNAGGESASIALAGSYTVTLGVSPTIAQLSIANPSAILDILGGGFTLTVSNASTPNDGTIRINGNKGQSNAQFRTTVNSTISGSGQIVLQLGSADLNDAIFSTVGAQFTQSASHTLRGAGTLSANLINLGAVRADSAGEVLLLNTNPKANQNGVIEAIDGGILRIQSVTVTQTGSGTIKANGGKVELSSGAVTGGAIMASPGFAVECTAGTSTLSGVTVSGDLWVQDAAVCSIKDGMVNNGVITINPDPGASNATLRADNAMTLGGTGEVWMRLGSNDLNDAILSTGNAVVLTQDVSHTVRGAGNLAANLINNGTVLADEPDVVLQLGTQPKTNNSLMGAINGGILRVTGIVVTQSDSGVLKGIDSTVSLSSGQVTGGKLASSGTGLVEGTTGNNVLTDVENTGQVGLLSSSNLLIKGNGLTNNGTVTINFNGGTGNSLMRFEQNSTLDGSGEVVMQLGSTDLNDAQFGTLNSTVTMAADHTIRGAGNLTANLVSNGTINADSVGEVLQLSSLEKTNNSLMTATAGTLRINAIKVTQGNGGVIKADGSDVELLTATIIGGKLSSNGGGALVTTSGTSVLQDVTLASGQLEVNDSTAVQVKGAGLTNNGEIIINPEGQTGNAAVQFAAPGALGGNGTVTLILGSADFNDAQLVALTNMPTTIGAGQTVRGNGTLNATGTMSFLGTLAPGSDADATGKFVGPGTLTLGPSTVFDMQVGGKADGQFDTMGGSQNITLDGTLQVSLVDGFVPVFGDKFAVVNTTGTVSGEFATVKGSAGPGAIWRPIYSAKKVEVIVTCYADLQPDGVLDLFDFLAYVNLFNAGSPDADCIQDGVLDLFDFLCYVNAFNGGC